jgi:hypothetical protein
MEKTKINYGEVEIDQDLDQPTMIRTTFFLESNLKDLLKLEAKKTNKKYQQLMREILHKHFDDEDSFESRISKLEKLISKA